MFSNLDAGYSGMFNYNIHYLYIMIWVFFCTFVTFQYKGCIYDHEIRDKLLGIGGIGKSPVLITLEIFENVPVLKLLGGSCMFF